MVILYFYSLSSEMSYEKIIPYMVTDIFNSGRFFFSTTTVINEVKLSLSSSVGTISKAIQAVELILTLQQAFNVLSVTMLSISLSFFIFLEMHSTSDVQLWSLSANIHESHCKRSMIEQNSY